jgi:hypothetical protein
MRLWVYVSYFTAVMQVSSKHKPKTYTNKNMKKIISTVFLLLTFSIYSQNRYEFVDEGNDKLFLSDSISKMVIKSLITDKPIVLIDGKPFRFQDLESQKSLLSKAEIEKIVAIDKQKGINIFGKFGEAGVLIITTNRSKKINQMPTDNNCYN